MINVLKILVGEELAKEDFETTVREFKERGIIHPRVADTLDSSRALRKGTAALLFYHALGVSGGVILHFVAPNERYVLRELIFQGIMLPGNRKDILSGKELVVTLNFASKYLLENKVDEE